MKQQQARRRGEEAIVLFSGGLDSTTTLAWAIEHGYVCTALSFDYGQRHRIELRAANRVASQFRLKRHLILKVAMDNLPGSALTQPAIAVPKRRLRTSRSARIKIPVTYVPGRNLLFLSYGVSWAEAFGIRIILMGANAIDYSGYPDCRPTFIKAFETCANLATKSATEGRRPFKILTPLIHLSKKEIVKLGLHLGVNYKHTFTCYDPLPGGRPCQKCESCQLRTKGFWEAGIPDPAI